MIIPLTGGTCVSQQSDLEVKLVDNGHTLLLAEKWTCQCADVKDHCERHPTELDLTEEDRVRRQLAMTDEAERIRRNSPHGLVSVCRCTLPWKAAEIVDKITGTNDGARMCHIDIYSRKRIQERNIFVASSKRKVQVNSIFTASPSQNYSIVD